MKTKAIHIDLGLLQRMYKQAESEGRHINRLVEDSFKLYLSERKSPSSNPNQLGLFEDQKE